jgi:hypothetical protein
MAVGTGEAVVDFDVVPSDLARGGGRGCARQIDGDQPLRIEAVIDRLIRPEGASRLALDTTEESARADEYATHGWRKSADGTAKGWKKSPVRDRDLLDVTPS